MTRPHGQAMYLCVYFCSVWLWWNAVGFYGACGLMWSWCVGSLDADRCAAICRSHSFRSSHYQIHCATYWRLENVSLPLHTSYGKHLGDGGGGGLTTLANWYYLIYSGLVTLEWCMCVFSCECVCMCVCVCVCAWVFMTDEYMHKCVYMYKYTHM